MDTEVQKMYILNALNEMKLSKQNASRKQILNTLKGIIGYEPEVSFNQEIEEKLNESNETIKSEELEIKIIFGDPNNLSFMIYSV